MAKFNVIAKTFIANRLYEAGDVVELNISDFKPALHPALAPVEDEDEAAPKRGRAPKGDTDGDLA